MTSGRRWASAAALAVVVALSVVVGAGGMARATTAYRYWAYYVGSSGQWQYSQRGPGSQPADGDVQGWRFGVQTDSGTLAPRVAPDFDRLCASTAAQAGRVRVGLVIDFGTTADAPAGEHPPARPFAGCVSLADGATGYDVLTAAVGRAGVRIGTGSDAGLVCGIDGYPKTECAPVVQVGASTPTQTSAATPTPGATPTPAPTFTRAAPARSSASLTTATTPVPSSPAPTPSADSASGPASSPAPTTSEVPLASASLSALRAKGASHFPTGAVVGGVLAVALAAAAVARFVVARRGRGL